ncbi:MAG: gliding motility-associated C-terminal domain-containing protein, partial [Flavobacterium sp.]|nr:gliding motility-associated C-terminal domain-containing protein [Pedobacter sp.]
CSESKGNVNIKLNILKEQENLSFTIVDSTGQVLESGAIVYNANFNIIDKNFRLPSGSFQMFVKGSSGCDILLTSFKLSKNELSLVSDSIGVFNDQCDQKIGRILGIKIKGLSKPPKGRIIKWTDSKGNPIGASVPFLLNIGAGIYTMHLTDPGGCELTATFTVLNEAPDLLPPKTRDVKICLPGKIQVITEAVALADSYKLYKASEENPIIIEENKDGKFSVTVNETTTFYVSYVQGICESSKTLLLVSVAAAGVIIPNTFTPNADGINDTWSIKAIENFPGSRIEIYNRYGNKVFNSIDYDKPFDGRKNDVDLPDGVYYYKIEIPELSCEGKVIGSLTILR